MNRLASRTLAAATLLVADGAAAHPGHGAPHLLHQADAMLGVWVIGLSCVGVLAFVLARRIS